MRRLELPSHPVRAALLTTTLLSLCACMGSRGQDPEVAALRQQMDRIEQRLDTMAKAAPAAHGAPGGSADHHAADPRQEPQTALDLLVEGNRALLDGRPRPADLSAGRRKTLAGGQKPYAVVVGCSDSRCPPEHVFGAGVGDVFVVRTAGNVVPADVVASVEYAVAHLGAKLVVCIGHTKCGAVKATVAGVRETPAVGELIDRIAPAVDAARAEGRTGADLVERAVVNNAFRTRDELCSRSALLAAKSAAGEVRFVVARQILDDDAVEWLDSDGLRAPQATPDPITRAPMRRSAAPTPVMTPPAPAPKPLPVSDHGGGGGHEPHAAPSPKPATTPPSAHSH